MSRSLPDLNQTLAKTWEDLRKITLLAVRLPHGTN